MKNLSFYFSYSCTENKLAHSCTYCTFANDIQHTYEKCTTYMFICVYVLPYLQYSQFKCILISRYIKVTEILNKDVFFFSWKWCILYLYLIKFAMVRLISACAISVSSSFLVGDSVQFMTSLIIISLFFSLVFFSESNSVCNSLQRLMLRLAIYCSPPTNTALMIHNHL